MIIPDNETAIDLLYYEAIAGTIVELLKASDEQPLTVGVHGDWGAGKSSVLMMLEDAFDDEDTTLCIRFNGWLFQGLEDTKAVLIETIVAELLRKRTMTATLRAKADQVLKRVDWMKVARKMGGLALTATTGIPTIGQANDILGAAKSLVEKGGELDGDDIAGFVSGAGNFLKDAEPDSIPTQIHAFREEFLQLLAEANIERLVVVVDDLDRCLPETAIETLEAIRLFLFVPGAAFVIAADEAMIEYAVTKHFPDLPSTSGATSYARNYLEKLIQVPFRLPPLGYVETRTYISLLNAGRSLGENDANFRRLVDHAREVLRRPWGGDGFERSKLTELFGEIPADVESALQLADQIAPLLTDGARGNPRQIKRFLNTMNLRLAIARQRGIEADLTHAALAKLMLAERFEPRLFEQLEREATETGNSATIQTLERSVSGAAQPVASSASKPQDRKRAKSSSVVDAQAASEESEWLQNAWARRWAKLDPPLSDVDIRPYLFVSRDRKAVFTATSTIALMEEWVDKLCGSRLGAKAVAEEVRKLPSADAEQVFNAVARRVAAATELKQKPPGIDGLAELCKTLVQLQGPFVALLRSLPVEKLGPWVAVGWNDVITETAALRDFQALKVSWAEQDVNDMLKTAATSSRSRPR